MREPINIFEDLTRCQKEIKDMEAQVHESKHKCKEYELEYRIASVKRVISFVRDNFKEMPDREVDVYLVHCLNKLNGNIDGVELGLRLKKAGGGLNEK